MPDLTIEGMGGSEMEEAGADITEAMTRRSAMGVAEVLGRIPSHLRLLRELEKRFAQKRYDLVVLVDYPGFHLRVAALAAARGIPVLYYIAPQLWAWGERRAASLRKNIRTLAVILPFEESFFYSRGITTRFVGHPLLDLAEGPSKAQGLALLGLDSTSPVIGLFPGSRPQEVRRLWPVLRDTAFRLRQEIGDLQIVVAAMRGESYPGSEEFVLQADNAAAVLAAADACLCKSGTTTLEAVLSDTPMVIAYRMHPTSYAIARRLVRVPFIGLVNLVAGQQVSPEFVQNEANPAALSAALLPLLDVDAPEALAQRSAFRIVRERLGQPGAGRRVAELARSLVA